MKDTVKKMCIRDSYYTKILDHSGNVLIEKTSAERSVIKESTAWLLTSAMEDVVKNGTGTACQLDNMTVAGKTGTTDDYNDLWFVAVSYTHLDVYKRQLPLILRLSLCSFSFCLTHRRLHLLSATERPEFH